MQDRLLHARTLHRQGRHDEAAAVHREIAEKAECAESLLYLASLEMRRGRPERALAWYERARAADPENMDVARGMAMCLQATGALDAAVDAFRAALAIDAEDIVSLLGLGAVFECLGRRDEADAAWTLAIEVGGDRASIEARFPKHRGLLQLADQAARRRSKALLGRMDAVVGDLTQRHGSAAVDRFRGMVEVAAGRRRPDGRHPQQQPFQFWFPGLPDQPWFEPDQVGIVEPDPAEFETVIEEIRADRLARSQLQPYVGQGRHTDDEEHSDRWRPLRGSPDWGSLHLYRDGSREPAARHFPRTLAWLDRLPLVDAPGHGPEAFFSVLSPDTAIPPHYGQANYKLTAHLGLEIPEDCGISVAGHTRVWRPGRCLVFDDSFLHEAWNRSTERRVVLIFDVWNPHLSEIERDALRAMFRSLSEWRGSLRDRLGLAPE